MHFFATQNAHSAGGRAVVGSPTKSEDDDIQYYTRELVEIFRGFPSHGMPPMPSKIYDNLYIGTAADAENIKLLQGLRIQYVLNCGGISSLRSQRELYYDKDSGVTEYEEYPSQDTSTYDMRPHIMRSQRFLDHARARGRVLVYCPDVNRSYCICMAYLNRKGISLLNAASTIKRARRTPMTNVGFIRQLVLMARDMGMVVHDKPHLESLRSSTVPRRRSRPEAAVAIYGSESKPGSHANSPSLRVKSKSVVISNQDSEPASLYRRPRSAMIPRQDIYFPEATPRYTRPKSLVITGRDYTSGDSLYTRPKLVNVIPRQYNDFPESISPFPRPKFLSITGRDYEPDSLYTRPKSTVIPSHYSDFRESTSQYIRPKSLLITRRDYDSDFLYTRPKSAVIPGHYSDFHESASQYIRPKSLLITRRDYDSDLLYTRPKSVTIPRQDFDFPEPTFQYIRPKPLMTAGRDSGPDPHYTRPTYGVMARPDPVYEFEPPQRPERRPNGPQSLYVSKTWKASFD